MNPQNGLIANLLGNNSALKVNGKAGSLNSKSNQAVDMLGENSFMNELENNVMGMIKGKMLEGKSDAEIVQELSQAIAKLPKEVQGEIKNKMDLLNKGEGLKKTIDPNPLKVLGKIENSNELKTDTIAGQEKNSKQLNLENILNSNKKNISKNHSSLIGKNNNVSKSISKENEVSDINPNKKLEKMVKMANQEFSKNNTTENNKIIKNITNQNPELNVKNESLSKNKNIQRVIGSHAAYSTQLKQVNGEAPIIKASASMKNFENSKDLLTGKNRVKSEFSSALGEVKNPGTENQSLNILSKLDGKADSGVIENNVFDFAKMKNSKNQVDSKNENQTMDLTSKINPEEVFGQNQNQQIKGAMTASTALNSNLAEMGSLDISNLENTPREKLIEKISKYIESNNIGKKGSLDMNISHKDLGKFNIKVQGDQNAGLEIQIASQDQKAGEFFKWNQKGLIDTLTNNGIKLADLKLDNSQMQNQGEKSSNQNSFAGNGQNSYNDREETDSSSDRRKNMWELLSEKRKAA